MAASYNDSKVLGGDPTFQGRVQSSMLSSAVAISSEGPSVDNHSYRLTLVHQILATPTGLDNYAKMFSLTVATDPTVLGAATQSGTVALTTGNVATQQALVTDAQIGAAISGQFNAFVQGMPV
jgi:hypothetical protein